MPRLILHIGTHKTATTSIQHFFSDHHKVLASRGLFYPGYDLIGKKPHYAHLGMVNALVGQHKSYTPAEARAFFTAVRDRMADHDITLISAEPLYRHVMSDTPSSGAERDPEAYWPARMRFIEHIHDLLGPAEVVVVFRRQADYAQSLYQEHIKVTQYDRPFAEFLRDFWFHFAFAEQARAWDSVFPGLRALRFDKMVASGDAVGEFCRLLDLPVAGLPEAARHNEAMPADLVILKRIMQGASSRDEAARRIAQIEPLLNPEMLKNLEPRSFFASPEDREAYQRGFDDSNAELRRHFVAEHAAGDDPVFPASFRPGGHFGDSPHPRVMAAVLRLAGEGGRPEAPPPAAPTPAPALIRPCQAPAPAPGTPLELTVLGDDHARFFLPTTECSLVRCGFAGGRLKISQHGAPSATLGGLVPLTAPLPAADTVLPALQEAAARAQAQALCLAFGQSDLELGYYAARLAPGEGQSADLTRQDFVADLLARYDRLVAALNVDPARLALKAVNLTLLRDRNFTLRALNRALGQGKTDLKPRLDPLLISEKEQNALARQFNSGLQDIAARRGLGFLDLTPALAQPGPVPRLAPAYRPASLSLLPADTIELRQLHIRSLLQVFGADPADYLV